MTTVDAGGSRFELDAEGTLERRVLDAADECVCRWGWSKTTMHDIAAQAEVSRATLYRAFPGGRDAIYEALHRQRVLSFFHDLTEPLTAGDDLLTVLTDAIVAAATALRDDEHVQYQLAHEPGPLLQQLSFTGLDRLLAVSRVLVAPHLARFASLQDARRLAEWATRIVVSYTLEPSRYLDLTDPEAVRSYVQTRALAGIDRAETQHPSVPRTGDALASR